MTCNEPDMMDVSLPVINHTEPDLKPLFDYLADRQPLIDENVQYINADETTMQPATIQAHIEDTYTPGDRLQSKPARKASNRRQPPRPGHYRCTANGCERTFDRQCELK